MKKIIFYLVIAFLSVFCFSKAQAQGDCVSTFGTNRDTCWSKTIGYLWMPVYSNNNASVFLTTNSLGQVVLDTISIDVVIPEDTFVTIDRVILMGQSNGGGTGDSIDLYDSIFLGQKFDYTDTMSRVLIANLVNGTYNPYLLGVNTVQYLPGEIGSDLFFGQRWVENTHQNKLLIHKRVRDGGAISLFQKGGSYYTDLMNIFDSADTKLAEQGYKARNVAWVWVQGESDKTSDSATYSAALYQLVDSLKADSVIMPYTKMIIAGISTGSKMYGAGVRAAQEAFVADNPLARFINTDSFTFEADTLHYDARGLANLGYTAYQYSYDADSKLPQDIKTEKLGSLIVGLGNQDVTPDRAVVELNAPTYVNDTVIVQNNSILAGGNYVSGLKLKGGDIGTFSGVMHDGSTDLGVWFDENGYIWLCNNNIDGRNSVRVDGFGDLYVGNVIGSVVAQYESRARTMDTSTWHHFALADSLGNVTYLVKANGTANYYKRVTFHDNIIYQGQVVDLNKYFVDGGSSKGATQVLGTNDANSLDLETNNTTNIRIFSNGNTAIGTTTDAGFKLDVNGTFRAIGNSTIRGLLTVDNITNSNYIRAVSNVTNPYIEWFKSGFFGIRLQTKDALPIVTGSGLIMTDASSTAYGLEAARLVASGGAMACYNPSGNAIFSIAGSAINGIAISEFGNADRDFIGHADASDVLQFRVGGATSPSTGTLSMSLLSNGRVLLSQVPEYADNAAAILGGLAVGTIYRTGDILKIVH